MEKDMSDEIEGQGFEGKTDGEQHSTESVRTRRPPKKPLRYGDYLMSDEYPMTTTEEDEDAAKSALADGTLDGDISQLRKLTGEQLDMEDKEENLYDDEDIEDDASVSDLIIFSGTEPTLPTTESKEENTVNRPECSGATSGIPKAQIIVTGDEELLHSFRFNATGAPCDATANANLVTVPEDLSSRKILEDINNATFIFNESNVVNIDNNKSNSLNVPGNRGKGGGRGSVGVRTRGGGGGGTIIGAGSGEGRGRGTSVPSALGGLGNSGRRHDALGGNSHESVSSCSQAGGNRGRGSDKVGGGRGHGVSSDGRVYRGRGSPVNPGFSRTSEVPPKRSALEAAVGVPAAKQTRMYQDDDTHEDAREEEPLRPMMWRMFGAIMAKLQSLENRMIASINDAAVERSGAFPRKPECLPVATPEDLAAFEVMDQPTFDRVVRYLGALSCGSTRDKAIIILKDALVDSFAVRFTVQGREPGSLKLEGTRFSEALYAAICKDIPLAERPSRQLFVQDITSALKASKERYRKAQRKAGQGRP